LEGGEERKDGSTIRFSWKWIKKGEGIDNFETVVNIEEFNVGRIV